MNTMSHGPYDQLKSEPIPTSVTTLVAESHGSVNELHNSLDLLNQRLETLLNRADIDPASETVEAVPPSTSLMCNELLKLNDGIDSATRRVNMLMARLEL